jgi:hypothetical protein
VRTDRRTAVPLSDVGHFVNTGTKQDCSVTITNGGAVGGANATGTFSATFTGSGGAVVTNGVFDTPVKAPPTAANR